MNSPFGISGTSIFRVKSWDEWKTAIRMRCGHCEYLQVMPFHGFSLTYVSYIRSREIPSSSPTEWSHDHRNPIVHTTGYFHQQLRSEVNNHHDRWGERFIYPWCSNVEHFVCRAASAFSDSIAGNWFQYLGVQAVVGSTTSLTASSWRPLRSAGQSYGSLFSNESVCLCVVRCCQLVSICTDD